MAVWPGTEPDEAVTTVDWSLLGSRKGPLAPAAQLSPCRLSAARMVKGTPLSLSVSLSLSFCSILLMILLNRWWGFIISYSPRPKLSGG